ncbi:bifunctional glycosyltransferase family 2/GtrA family protein [Enterococcus sp. CWB-B31]|uniref:bifunctional glycosyltransferase family 2/GtrA family protein n=1 Tax=Enterococcus sp. CWB-B31 TaxID=2885159 RepID=UPI001E4928FE|nr:bifunctional glycosyltransferase family 2/GtrA family protein [Enterococcus sp. CWB-B31]MCB5953475.1 bifunctional glycosyltransferase family 2/GtrA family protein [Enterococcus sp. CWB-B31]
MNSKDCVGIIIPSLEPDNKFLCLLKDLKESGFNNIFVINDGSNESYLSYYQKAVTEYESSLLTHYVNLGKGRALKTAFNHILNEYPKIKSVVAVDSDGQHRIEDIEKCYQASIKNEHALIMGCRNFSKETSEIPFRSRFGNIMTCKVLKMFCGIQLTDTQTGLRGISRELMKIFLTVDGERFEYEMNMILETRERNISIVEIPIQTIYIEENATSHFNPLKDSLRIYSLFVKFIFSSVSSFFIDIILFTLFTGLLSGASEHYILYSAYLARAISSLFNYQINKTKVFKAGDENHSALVKYIILCIVQILISSFATEFLFNQLNINVTGIKIVVDAILFLISFQIQRNWVFKKK